MTAKIKFALAAAFSLLAAPAFAQQAPAFSGQAHVLDNSTLIAQIAGQTSAAQMRLTSLVLGSAEARLAPKFAAIEARPIIQQSLFAAEMPMLRRPIQIASR